MRRIFRTLAVFFAAILFVGCVCALDITAGAEEQLRISVDYDYYGLPFVSILPSSEGNVIRYTLDGTTPTVQSQKYELGSEIQISEKTIVRAAEFTADGEWIAGVKKTVKRKVAPVEFEFEYRNTETVVWLSCATAGAKIYYTTDGSKPNEDSPVYVSALTFSETTKIRAYAALEDYTPSSAYSATAKISMGTGEKAAKDTIKYKTTYLSDSGVAYVTILPEKSSNIIYYTTDGSAPSKSSKQYSKRIKFTEPGVLRALEYTKKGELVGSLKLNVAPRVMPVQLSCVDFAVGMRTIELTTKTPGATIYYTVDGSKPSVEYSEVYTSPVVVSNMTKLQAFAVKDGYTKSLFSSEFGAYIPVALKDFNEQDPTFDEVLSYINERRRANGLYELILDPDLNYVANVRAKEVTIEYSHKRPNTQSYYSVFEENGISTLFSMESLSVKNTAREFVTDVLSRKDEADLLLTDKQEIDSIGVGYCKRNGRMHWVLIIARIA